MTRSDIIPMVLFGAILVSLGINTPHAANEIIARLFDKSISNSELQPSQSDVNRFQAILTDKSEPEIRKILAQRALGTKITESVLADYASKNEIKIALIKSLLTRSELGFDLFFPSKLIIDLIPIQVFLMLSEFNVK